MTSRVYTPLERALLAEELLQAWPTNPDDTLSTSPTRTARHLANALTSHPGPRTFVLRRHVDPTGISGTGVVAEGIEFTDGTVVIRWTAGDHHSTVMWPDLESVEAIHGHGGATQIEWAIP